MPIQAVRWTPEMSVGVKVLDDDHRRLFALMNKVIAAFYAGVGAGVVGSTLDELENYTREHFAREEAMLVARGYGPIDAHRAQHHHLVDKLVRLREEKSSVELIPALNEWLTSHILHTDLGYRDLFR